MIEVDVPGGDTPKTAIFISKCKGFKKGGNAEQVYIKLKGKAKMIAIVNSEFLSVVFDDVVTTCEVTRSKKVVVHANNTGGTFQCDKSEEINITIPKASCTGEAKTCVYTTECNAIVVQVPPEKEDGDYKEVGIPCTILTTFENGNVTNTIEGAITEC